MVVIVMKHNKRYNNMSEIRKLSKMDANDILTRTTFDEVPGGYRDEVYVEEENGDIIKNWFLGSDGAVSNSGTTLTTETFNKKIEISNAVDGTIIDVRNVPISCENS